MKGILARASHRCVAVDGAKEAWDFIQQNVRVDLVFTELKLPGEGGLGLVQRLKDDCILKYLPVVVYAEHADRDNVKRILELRVQNILIKPYHDDLIYAELTKAAANPWRNRHFEEENSFCKQMEFSTAELHRMLEALRGNIEGALPALERDGQAGDLPLVDRRLTALAHEAETAGAWGVVDCLGHLNDLAAAGKWTAFGTQLPSLSFAGRLIFQHLNPSHFPTGFVTPDESQSGQEVRERARWFDAVAEKRCPVLDWPQVRAGLDALPGCPIIDTAAGAYQMAANGHPSCLTLLMDIVDKDPGLAAQMLISGSKARSQENDPTPVEDPRLAVGLLGETRLASLARALVTVEERFMHAPPHYSWTHFWMFQMGVARMARFTAHYLELYSMEPQAYMAGLLHDLGKLLLLKLHPYAFQAAVKHAREHNAGLHEAERLLLGCTTREMAVYFAEKHGLPAPYLSVLRWVEDSEQATEHANLVAVVSLARDLCRHNQVGFCGDTPHDVAPPIEQTPEWRVLRNSLYPSFDLRKFELQVHADCRELKLELHGRLKQVAVA